MADGIKVINAEGEICIQDEYPLMVATTGITNSGSQTGSLTDFGNHYFKYWDISGDSDEILFVETFTNQGVFCRYNNGTTIRMMAQNGSDVDSTSHAPTSFNYFKAKRVSALSASSGYGIRVFDGSSNMTFDSGYPAVNIRSVGIIPGSSSTLTTYPPVSSATIESSVNYMAFGMGGHWVFTVGYNPQLMRFIPLHGTLTPYRTSTTQISTWIKGQSVGPVAGAVTASTSPAVCYMTAIV